MKFATLTVVKCSLIAALAWTGFSSVASAAFQEALWGARPAALVGAYSALADDANAPAYNPAGISMVEKNELTFMYARLFSGVNFYAGQDTSRLGLGYFSYVPTIKDKKYGSYAISWTNFAATNLYREDSFSLSVADSYQFESLPSKSILSYGTNLKFLKRSFSPDQRTDQDPVFRDGPDSSAMTVDLGLQFRPNVASFPGLRFGMTGQNLTEPNIGLSATDRVPMRLSVGVAYKDAALPLIGPAFELSRRNGRTLVTGAWESLMAHETLAFRFGANADEVGGGVGYQFRLLSKMMMRFDYAIIWPLNVDGTNGSHRVSISSSF